MAKVPIIIINAEVRTRWISGFVSTRALLGRGGRPMIEGSTGSTPRDCAGGPSMRISSQILAKEHRRSYRAVILIHRICIAFSGFLNPNMVLSKTRLRAATLVLSWNVIKFWML